MNIIVYILEM